MSASTLESNKVYDMHIPEKGSIKRVVFLGETSKHNGRENFWLYEVKNNRLVTLCLREGTFLFDGETISPLNANWGRTVYILDYNDARSRRDCMPILEKMKKLDAVRF